MARPPMPVGTWGNIKSRELDTGQWVAQCRFRDFDGVVRQVKAHGPSKAAAERRLKVKLAARAIPAAGDASVTEHTTIAALCGLWIDGRDDYKPQTIIYYRDAIESVITPALGALRVRELTAGRTLAFLTAQTPGNAKRARTVLKFALGIAVAHEVIQTNPVLQLPAPKQARAEVRVLTAADLVELRSRITLWEDGWLDADGRTREKRGAARSPLLAWFLDLLLATGVRSGEMMAMRWGEIDLDAMPPTAVVSGTVVLLEGRAVRQSQTKTESGHRQVALPPFAVGVLEEMREFRRTGADDEPLFPAEDGGHRTVEGMRSAWRRARVSAGGPDDPDRWRWVEFRTMRRTVATAIDRASGLEDAAAQLGHAGTAVTARHYVAAKARRAPDLTEILEKLAGRASPEEPTLPDNVTMCE